MPAANECQIVLGASSIEVTREPVASNTPELLPKSAISGVYPIKINSAPSTSSPDYPNWQYRFPDMVMVCVSMNNADQTSRDFIFELQEISNQPTWTGDLAGQQQCVDDINTWLAI